MSIGEPHVENNGVWPFGVNHADRLGAGFRSDDLERIALQGFGHGIAQIRLVIDNKQSLHGLFLGECGVASVCVWNGERSRAASCLVATTP
ncbi:MAG: hypothetical protein R3C10_25420 [Pirellulales bacterium]